MKNLKKYNDFLQVYEAVNATASTTIEVGGPNYDGSDVIYMPAGKYEMRESNEVKFTIKNTGKTVYKIDSNSIEILSNPYSEKEGLVFSEWDRYKGTDINPASLKSKYDVYIKDLSYMQGDDKSTLISVDLNDPITIDPGKYITFVVDVVINSYDEIYRLGQQKWGRNLKPGVGLFTMTIYGNNSKFTYPSFIKPGELSLEWVFDREVSYFN